MKFRVLEFVQLGAVLIDGRYCRKSKIFFLTVVKYTTVCLFLKINARDVFSLNNVLYNINFEKMLNKNTCIHF